MMQRLFDNWWRHRRDGYAATLLMEKCFTGGFWRGVRVTAIAVSLIVLVSSLSGCKDQYRYPCQNPENFHKAECQKPKCLFTQMCPEYLVAPVLEKQINATQQPNQSASEPSTGK